MHILSMFIYRLEAASIKAKIGCFDQSRQAVIAARIDSAIHDYGLNGKGDTYEQKFACPLFEKGTGCLVHDAGKPVACTVHACYENKADLPPDELQIAQERRIDDLNARTYGRRQPWLPLPLALKSES